MKRDPLYRSKCSAKNFWKEYCIFDDRIELDTFFKTITIPFDDVEGAAVAHSYAEGVRLHLRGGKLGIKLDWADLHEHVVLDKSTGVFRHLAFTPDDPEAFRTALDEAIKRFREEKGDKG